MSVGLDVLTPAGKVTLQHERMAYALFEDHYANLKIEHTDKDQPEPFDGRIMQSGKVVALIETKCRVNVNWQQFQTRYKNEWLLTDCKIKIAADCAGRERVPLYGFCFIVQDQVLLIKQLSDANGNLVNYKTAMMTTQATVNGGTKRELTGFISMDDCDCVQLI